MYKVLMKYKDIIVNNVIYFNLKVITYKGYS